MFDWLYRQAKHVKKVAFGLGGVGVTLSTVIGKLSPVTAWIANLGALAIGGAGYSMFKNMEVAQSIVEKRQQIVAIDARLSLQRYPSKPEGYNSTTAVLNALGIEQVDDIVRQIAYVRDDARKHVPDSKWYANLNVLAQAIFMIPIVIINSMANLEVSRKDGSSSSDNFRSYWTTLDILNVTIVPACILSIYGLHTLYIAKNLRKMSSGTDGLYTTLSEAQQHLLFRNAEIRAFNMSCNDIESEKARCSAEIGKISPRIEGLSREIVDLNQRLGDLNRGVENRRSELGRCQRSLGECDRELKNMEMEEELITLNSDSEKHAGSIGRLSCLERRTGFSEEMKAILARLDELSVERGILLGAIKQNKDMLKIQEESLKGLRHELEDLEEKLTQLNSKKPEKMEEFIGDLARSQQLV